MTSTFKTATALSFILLFSSLTSCAQASDKAIPANKAEIEQIVKDYLLENPEIVREALILLQEKEERASITAVAQELRHDKRDFSIGPKNAKVTIVEFFDYNCSFCKTSTGWVKDVLAEYPKDVRFVFKELPILERRTRTSRNAAKAALAAKQQGKYLEMHFALMDSNTLSDKFITSAAIKLGLNMKKFKSDMAAPATEEQIEDTMFLANRIPGLSGTPFFVMNDEFIASGNETALQALLDKTLAN